MRFIITDNERTDSGITDSDYNNDCKDAIIHVKVSYSQVLETVNIHYNAVLELVFINRVGCFAANNMITGNWCS